ncbi:TolC family outer membrane protein [Aquicella lusitana]|uniref:Outer membrane protein n=1 Tax=Aquicella lusitana TaxID=254246 RepID=A0A370GCE5_9COXI|nr:TolC family outer membrane protein [Aquicella lusitana]RDI41495.1 outer membrane protein [Aquicella lusitana]VVC72611.1 Outer membrane protein TolC [Aquicella lusitana]
MKKRVLLLIALSSWQITASAADLIEVYQQALLSDPTYQQAVAQRLSTKEGVPISVSSLLPNLSVQAVPSVTRSGFAGSNFSVDANTGAPLSPRNNTARAYTLTLTVTQTVFDFSKFAGVAGAVATSKSADATLNASLQNLMTRVASAYFAVLRDEDNLSYNEAAKQAYAEQLDQVRQQYKVGLKTVTDVYTAQASYESAVASYIAAETTLANDRENLRVITGKYYPHLSKLSEAFPLVTPQPANMEAWVKTAILQNWSIKSSQYSVDSSRQSIRQQIAGHLPTVNLQGTMDRLYENNINGYDSLTSRNGPGTQTDRAIALNINVPIFSGGGVVAQTNQAVYNYQSAEQQLEQTIRNTANTTRQSYLNIIAGISQIKADQQAIKSNISSLEGMEASYRVGTETLVNVLNQRQKLYQAQTQYATDRYAFVNNVLALKQAAGTLSFDDLRAINAWLIETQSHPDKKSHRYNNTAMMTAAKNDPATPAVVTGRREQKFTGQ